MLWKRFSGYPPPIRAAHLAFVGQGNQEQQLKDLTRQHNLDSRVHFVGFQTNIPDWLAAATVWSFPTETENFSLALLEAFAAGCPVLSTWCQGNDEVLENGVNSLFTDVGDVDAQAAALKRMLDNADLRRSLSEGARKTAEKYSRDRMAMEYAQAYGSVDVKYADISATTH
jgi:glycosyltransferase involved in cell wall biosynthesis